MNDGNWLTFLLGFRLYEFDHFRHEATLSEARHHQFDEFVRAGGIGRQTGLRSPQPKQRHDPPSGSSAPWAEDNSTSRASFRSSVSTGSKR
jgi:hypothetical protein